MSTTAAQDAALGVPIERTSYADGDAGIVGQSIPGICKRIREGMTTAVMQSVAANALIEAGSPEGVRKRSSAFLDLVRAKVLYAPDPLGTETIKSAQILLCVKGAPVCIPMGDCDDLIVAVGTLCASAGMDVQVVRQDFGVDPTTGNKHQEHVLVEVLTEDGAWFALDPSSKTMPAGRKAPAQRETYHSPWDPQYGAPEGAQYIGMGAAPEGLGALPVFIWGHGWRRLPPTATIEDSMRHVGAGAIWEGAAMLQPQLDWLGQFWSVVDSKGRSWSVATTDAYQRALAKVWPADDTIARSDLLALVVSSAYQARAISTFPSHGQQAADALTRTWVVLLHRIGIRPEQYDTKQLRAQLQKQGTTQANMAVFDILLILAAAVGVAVVYGTIFYFSRDIINRALSLYEVDRELARKHAEWQKIVDKHLADGTPFSEQELQKLKDLEDAQAGLATKVIDTSAGKKTSEDIPWGLLAALGFVAAGTVVAVVYHKEIAEALAPKRKRLAA